MSKRKANDVKKGKDSQLTSDNKNVTDDELIKRRNFVAERSQYNTRIRLVGYMFIVGAVAEFFGASTGDIPLTSDEPRTGIWALLPTKMLIEMQRFLKVPLLLGIAYYTVYFAESSETNVKKNLLNSNLWNTWPTWRTLWCSGCSVGCICFVFMCILNGIFSINPIFLLANVACVAALNIPIGKTTPLGADSSSTLNCTGVVFHFVRLAQLICGAIFLGLAVLSLGLAFDPLFIASSYLFGMSQVVVALFPDDLFLIAPMQSLQIVMGIVAFSVSGNFFFEPEKGGNEVPSAILFLPLVLLPGGLFTSFLIVNNFEIGKPNVYYAHCFKWWSDMQKMYLGKPSNGFGDDD